MKSVIQRLREIRIIPLVRISRAERAAGLAEALAAGGILCAEVSMRAEEAAEAIRRMKKQRPDMLVGAGDVLTREQAAEALAAGAEFAAGPCLNPRMARYCLERKFPVFPGAVAAAEFEEALKLGLPAVKFFPAELNGGAAAIRSLPKPYSDLAFLPSGGISEKNLREYLACENVIACEGSWIAREDWIEEGNFKEIKKLCKALDRQLFRKQGDLGK